MLHTKPNAQVSGLLQSYQTLRTALGLSLSLRRVALTTTLKETCSMSVVLEFILNIEYSPQYLLMSRSKKKKNALAFFLSAMAGCLKKKKKKERKRVCLWNFFLSVSCSGQVYPILQLSLTVQKHSISYWGEFWNCCFLWPLRLNAGRKKNKPLLAMTAHLALGRITRERELKDRRSFL